MGSTASDLSPMGGNQTREALTCLRGGALLPMRKNLPVVLAVVATACGQTADGNPRICGSIAPRIQALAGTAAEQRQIMASCIEHWARRLAKSRQDSAQDVADAVFGACGDAVEMYVSMSAKENQPTEGIEAVSRYWRARALLVAVQTRAGDCPLPKE